MLQNDFENTPMLKLVMGLAIPSMIAQVVLNLRFTMEIKRQRSMVSIRIRMLNCSKVLFLYTKT